MISGSILTEDIPLEPYTKRSTTSNSYRHWYYDYVFNDFPPASVSEKTITGSLASKQNSFDGFKLPGWKDIIRRGSNATTPASGVLYTAELARYEYGTKWKSHNRNGPQFVQMLERKASFMFDTWRINDTNTPSGSVTTRVTNRCISRFLSACQNAYSAVELGQDIGEYKETLNTIHRPLGSLQTKLHSYLSSLTKAKRKYKNVPALRKVLADTYLEWRFGINPLVSDVADIVTKCGIFRFDTVPVFASASETFSSTVGSELATISGSGANGLNPTIAYKDDSIYSVRYKGAVRTDTDADGRSSMVKELRLLPEDWLPTAWDLLPYSWIADYFTNIGDIIQALSFGFSKIAWGEKSALNRRKRVYSDIHLANPIQTLSPSYVLDYEYPYCRKTGNSVFEVRRFSRNALLSSDLLPQFEFRIPSGKYPYLNLAALLFSRATKIVPFF